MMKIEDLQAVVSKFRMPQQGEPCNCRRPRCQIRTWVQQASIAARMRAESALVHTLMHGAKKETTLCPVELLCFQPQRTAGTVLAPSLKSSVST
eukprot:scaffold145912_cov18-Tisochrysis_lutea.AAC.1